MVQILQMSGMRLQVHIRPFYGEPLDTLVLIILRLRPCQMEILLCMDGIWETRNMKFIIMKPGQPLL